MKIFIAVGLIATSTPALAQELAHNPRQVSAALKAGCSVQQTHQMSGKIHHATTIVRCSKSESAQAKAPKPAG